MFITGKPFQPGLMFAGKACAYLSEAPFRCFTQGQLRGLTWTNTLAYYEHFKVTEGPGANVIKLLCPKFTNFRNKLEYLSLASLPQNRPPERCSNRVGSFFTNKHQTRLERLARDKHSILLQTFVNYVRKSFITSAHGFKYITLFFLHH